jgi:hypothetical protein
MHLLDLPLGLVQDVLEFVVRSGELVHVLSLRHNNREGLEPRS